MTTQKKSSAVQVQTTTAPKTGVSRATRGAKPRASSPSETAAPAIEPAAGTAPEAKAVAPATLATVAKPRKTELSNKKPKLVRDSFTLPESDYGLFKEMKARCLKAGIEVKKTELLRAALRLLAASNDEQLFASVEALERIKAGRPSKR